MKRSGLTVFLVALPGTALHAGQMDKTPVDVGGLTYFAEDADRDWSLNLEGNPRCLYRFEVRAGDRWVQEAQEDAVERSELHGPIDDTDPARFNAETWTAYQFRIEPGPPSTADWVVLGDWHVRPDSDDTSAMSSPWQLELRKGDILVFDIRVSAEKPVRHNAPERHIYTSPAPVTRGVWHSLVSVADFDSQPQGDGGVSVWLDGKKIVMCSIYAAPLAKLVGAKFIDGFVRAAADNRDMRDPDYFRSRLTLPLTDVVVGNSHAGLSAYNIPARKGICIHNGFDPARIGQLAAPEAARQSLGIETPHIVGMVASFSHFKDYDTYFEAARRICAQRDDVTFVAIGAGSNFADYQTQLPQAQFPRIRLLGRRADVESIVNILSVGVLISNTDTHGEGISNAIMEYMALGKPVVATDCGGNGELIVEGETGYLIANRDTAGLMDRINKLLGDAALAQRMGEAGRRRIADTFSLERMTAAYATLYRNLLARERVTIEREPAAAKPINH